MQLNAIRVELEFWIIILDYISLNYSLLKFCPSLQFTYKALIRQKFCLLLEWKMNGNYDICVSLLQYPSIEETDGKTRLFTQRNRIFPI